MEKKQQLSLSPTVGAESVFVCLITLFQYFTGSLTQSSLISVVHIHSRKLNIRETHACAEDVDVVRHDDN